MSNQALKSGDVFTIEGIERGSKGQLLVDGVNIKTGRKCKPVMPAKWAITEISSKAAIRAPIS